MYGVYVFAATVAMLGLLWLVAHPTEATHPFIPRLWRGERQVGTRATLAWLACTFGWVVTLYCHATAGLFVVACAVVALVRLVVVPVDRLRFRELRHGQPPGASRACRGCCVWRPTATFQEILAGSVGRTIRDGDHLGSVFWVARLALAAHARS
jgi:hypothetical protein